MSLVEIKNITAGYGHEVVVDDISFEVSKGELVGLIGLNGSGKSTLVKAICNILPHKGEVIVGDVATRRLSQKAMARLVGYIPQKSGISLDMSVLEVVMMGFNASLKLLESPGRDMKNRAKDMINTVGLGDKMYSNFMLLSEGQKQLVILARALVNEGNLMVMDEPESALDFSVRYRMMKLVREWVSTGDRAGLVTLHDTTLSLNCCDKLVLLKDKKIAGIIDTRSDTITSIESKLSMIYGGIQVIDTKCSSGKRNLVMVYDSGEV